MQKRSNALLAIGVAAFLVGAGLVVGVLKSSNTHTSTSASASVLVATQRIPAGTSGADALSRNLVTTRQVPSRVRSTDALTSSTQLSGRVLDVDVIAGQQLRVSQLRPVTLRAASITIPAGKQGVAVQLPFVSGGAGYVGAGDLVDIYGNLNMTGTNSGPMTKLLLTGVKVLDVSTEVAPRVESGEALRPAGQNVTYLLALDSDQAERVIFLAANGQLWMTLAGVNAPVPGPATPGRRTADVFQ